MYIQFKTVNNTLIKNIAKLFAKKLKFSYNKNSLKRR